MHACGGVYVTLRSAKTELNKLKFGTITMSGVGFHTALERCKLWDWEAKMSAGVTKIRLNLIYIQSEILVSALEL